MVAEKIVDVRHGGPIRIRRMYWHLRKTGLRDACLTEQVEQIFRHIYGPDAEFTTEEIESVLTEYIYAPNEFDKLAALAAASTFIAHTFVTNKEALGEYAEIAERIATVRSTALDTVRAKGEFL